jgi:hypothetical protein
MRSRPPSGAWPTAPAAWRIRPDELVRRQRQDRADRDRDPGHQAECRRREDRPLGGLDECGRPDVAEPLDVFRRLPNGDREVAADHPLHALLKQGPAPWLSSFAWRRALAHTAMAHGNGFSRVWRTEGGLLSLDHITLLQPGSARRYAGPAKASRSSMSRQGRGRRARVDLAGRAARSLPRLERRRLPRRHPRYLADQQNRETVALSLATERFAAKFFPTARGPRRSSRWTRSCRTMRSRSASARARAHLRGRRQRLQDRHPRIGHEAEGIQLQQPRLQLIETRKEQAVQHCTMYGVPPHKIGILDRATNNNIEHQGSTTSPARSRRWRRTSSRRSRFPA